MECMKYDEYHHVIMSALFPATLSKREIQTTFSKVEE